MSNVKISELNSVGAAPADDDIVPVVDASTSTTKKVTVSNLLSGLSGITTSQLDATSVVTESDSISSNDNDTTLPTSAAVKDYVDSQIDVEDLDVQGDTGGALEIDLNSETLVIAGGTGISTVGDTNTITASIDNTVATLAGTQTLTNKTLTSPVLNTGVSGSAVKDEDGMDSDSETHLATQQSIKAYVDAQILTKDNLDEIAAGTTNKHFTATDESKLDAIEASATADQTDAEIRAAVEAATNSNVFTDADHSKLDAIEASADVTDATTVAAAGALMDSEVTNLADVKAFDTADYATAAQGATADNALAASAVSTFGGTLIDDADAAAARTTLGASASGHTHSYAAQGANDDITSLTGLTTDLAITYGGTGASTAQAAIDALSAVSGATNEHVLTKDTSTGNAIWKASAGGSVALNDLTDVNIGTVGSSEDNYVLKYDHSSETWGAEPDVTGSGSGSPGGSDTQIQFNDGGNFGGSADLVWDNSNNRLGIGEDNPDRTLHVDSGSTDTVALFQSSADANAYINIEDANTVTAPQIGAVTDALVLRTSNTTAITIDSSGRVGIGGTPTSSLLELHSAASEQAIKIADSSTNKATTIGQGDNYTNIFGDTNNTGILLGFGTPSTGNAKVTITEAGKVGIGTTSPDYSLELETSNVDGPHVNLKSTGTDSYPRIRFENDAANWHILAPHGGNSDSFIIYDGSAYRFAITTDGNVGIGTTAPSTKLHVNSGATNTAALFESTDSGAGIKLTDTTGSSTLETYGADLRIGVDEDGGVADSRITFRVDGSTKMLIDSSGNCGFGVTSPSERIEAFGNIKCNAANGKGFVLNSTTTTGIFRQNADDLGFTVGGSERMRIDASGNVGIGTDSPDTLLECVGADPVLTIRDTETSHASASATLRFAESGAGDSLNRYFDIAKSGESLVFIDDNAGSPATRLTIDASGNVGIGGTPTLGVLEVAAGDAATAIAISEAGTGNKRFALVPLASGGWTTYATSSDGGSFVAGITQLGGNVGIGGTPATYPLEIHGNSAALLVKHPSGPAARLFAWSTDCALSTNSHATADILFATGSSETERMRIDSSGYVGIGDDSPNRPLVVSSSQNIIASLESTDADVYITLSDDTSTSDSSQRIGVTGDDMHFWTDSVERMRIDSDGMVTTSGAANTNGDSRRTISIDDTTAMAAGVGGGISFGGKYKSDGTITRFAGIWGEKENGNNEDESGQLHLGTREDNGTVSSDLVIGSSGQLGIGGANYGTDGYVLTSGGASAAPSWESLTAGDTLPVEDSTSIAKDSSGSNDKEMRIDVGAITEGVTRVITMGDRDVDLASGGTFQDYDADTAKTDVTQTFTKPQRASVTTITVQNSTQYQADFSEGNNFYLSLASSVGYSLLAPTNVVAGQSGIITIKQTNGGTIAFNSIFKFEDGDTPPALSGGGTYNQLVYYVESSTHIVAKLLRNTS